MAVTSCIFIFWLLYHAMDKTNEEMGGSMKALLLVNVKAQGFSGDEQLLIDLFHGSNMEITSRVANSEDEAQDLFEKLIDAHDLVIIAGGDGTISSLLPHIIASQKPLGLLPLGSDNDFARSIGLSEDPKLAAKTIIDGERRSVDVGYADGRPFLNALNIGLGEQIASDHGGLSKNLFGSFAYPYRWLKSYRKNKGFTTDIVLGDETQATFRADQISVANSESFGRHLTADKTNSLESGELSVMAVRPIGVIGWLKLLPQMLFGDPSKVAGVAASREQTLTIETRPPKSYSLDGEWAGETPVDIKIRPQHLEVYAPV